MDITESAVSRFKRDRITANRTFVPNRTPYTLKDDMKIIRYIMDNDWYSNYSARNPYFWMEINGGLKRTYLSLRNRVTKIIIPNLRKYNLTKNQMRKFQVGRKKMKEGKRPMALIPPVEVEGRSKKISKRIQKVFI